MVGDTLGPVVERPGDIHAFWFADALGDPARAKARMPWWFGSDADTDRLITERYATVLQAAGAGALSSWEGEPRSCLALVIVLDQFPRNIHRAKPAAFAYDASALEITRRGLAAGHLQALATIEQAFFLMPFQHCEDLACQRESVAHFERMVEGATPEWREVARGVLDYARLHLEIVERCGRFPHRNAILGRVSTAQEIDYLASTSESFGQGSAG